MPRGARSPAERFSRAGARAARRCTGASCAQVAPGDEPADAQRAEPRAARLARHDGGRPRARAQQPGRRRHARGARAGRGARRRSARRSARSSRPGVERDGRRAAGRAAARGARARRARARRSTRSTPPTPRTRCSTASRRSASPSRGGWPSRSRRAGVDAAWLDRVARARRPGDRRGAALGRRVADRARRWPASCATRPSA